jgi:hypothetical protein
MLIIVVSKIVKRLSLNVGQTLVSTDIGCHPSFTIEERGGVWVLSARHDMAARHHMHARMFSMGRDWLT